MKMLAVAFTALILLAACGGGGGGSTTSTPLTNLTGTYQFQARETRGRVITGTAFIQQNGRQLTGSTTNSLGATARLTGTVTGAHASLQLTGTNNPVNCTVEADVAPDGLSASGTFRCTDGTSGDFTLQRA